MPRTDTLDLIHKAMFTDQEVALSEADQHLLQRIKSGYAIWVDKPHLSDREMRDYLMVTFHQERNQALKDISYIKLLLGNVTNASKEFFRYKVNYLLDQATTAAMAGNERKAKSLVKVAEVFVKNNRTDIDEGEKLPFDKIVISDWSFSVDPAVVGVSVKPGTLERAKKLKQKYLDELGIEDVEPL